jgi:hypothetical protein
MLKRMGLFPATREGETHGRCLPVITEEDICDRSKSDAFTKVFAFIQCAWLVTQCSTRAAVGLPLTELELMTLAFIVTALVMYGFWWYKPFDVQRATMLLCPDEKAIEIRSRLGQDSKGRKQQRQKNLTGDGFAEFLAGPIGYLNDNVLTADKAPMALKGLMFTTIGTVISGLHIFAWSWSFPSYTIRILWRVFSVAATCSLPAPFILTLVIVLISGAAELDLLALIGVLGVACMAVYVISRLGLIVLVFYCFSSMPAAVYETVNWNTIFPHFS